MKMKTKKTKTKLGRPLNDPGGAFLPEALRQRRRLAGLTQAALADALGVGISSVSRWESGENAPTAQQAQDIAELLGCTRRALGREVRVR